jgi:hypothetical protein
MEKGQNRVKNYDFWTAGNNQASSTGDPLKKRVGAFENSVGFLMLV